jgi:hypothetical protein
MNREFFEKYNNPESRIAVTQFLVEADDFAYHELWSKFCKKSSYCQYPEIENWDQINGFLITVGKYDDRSVCISLNWCILDGCVVCFWNPTSELIDHKMIENWFEKYYPNPNKRCDANNFHHCLNAVKKKS